MNAMERTIAKALMPMIAEQVYSAYEAGYNAAKEGLPIVEKEKFVKEFIEDANQKLKVGK